MPGTLILLGGNDVGEPSLAGELLSRTAGPNVVALPTAAAFEGPEEAMVAVASWLGPFGAQMEGVMALTRTDAALSELIARLDAADLVYLSDGAALHLRTVLRATPLLERLRAVLERGAVLVASGAAATVLCDPMVDPRGGAPTVGLGLVTEFLFVAHGGPDGDDPDGERLARTIALSPPALPIVVAGPGSGVVKSDDGIELIGKGEVSVYLAGDLVGIDALR